MHRRKKISNSLLAMRKYHSDDGSEVSMGNERIVFRLAERGEFLGSRKLGGEIRHELEVALDQGKNVVVDFEGITMVSHSFADELIGKLAAVLGIEAFRLRMRLVKVVPEIAPILRYVISNRLAEQGHSHVELVALSTSASKAQTSQVLK
jgi:hypothetical protein